MIKCAGCGKERAQGKFCPECGSTDIVPEKKPVLKCAVCGRVRSRGKFCPECGSSEIAQESSELICANCGAKRMRGKFCSECGSTEIQTTASAIASDHVQSKAEPSIPEIELSYVEEKMQFNVPEKVSFPKPEELDDLDEDFTHKPISLHKPARDVKPEAASVAEPEITPEPEVVAAPVAESEIALEPEVAAAPVAEPEIAPEPVVAAAPVAEPDDSPEAPSSGWSSVPAEPTVQEPQRTFSRYTEPIRKKQERYDPTEVLQSQMKPVPGSAPAAKQETGVEEFMLQREVPAAQTQYMPVPTQKSVSDPDLKQKETAPSIAGTISSPKHDSGFDTYIRQKERSAQSMQPAPSSYPVQGQPVQNSVQFKSAQLSSMQGQPPYSRPAQQAQQQADPILQARQHAGPIPQPQQQYQAVDPQSGYVYTSRPRGPKPPVTDFHKKCKIVFYVLIAIEFIGFFLPLRSLHSSISNLASMAGENLPTTSLANISGLLVAFGFFILAIEAALVFFSDYIGAAVGLIFQTVIIAALSIIVALSAENEFRYAADISSNGIGFYVMLMVPLVMMVVSIIIMVQSTKARQYR